jgi:NAD(P)H-hydrate epimerase
MSFGITGNTSSKSESMPRVTSPLPPALYRAEDAQALDRYAIEQCGIPGLTLMERAGLSAFEVLRERWPEARRIHVLCGLGNNGGDGYVLARRAHEAGLSVKVVQVGDATRLRGDALTVANQAIAAGLFPCPFEGSEFQEADVVVDALLGTGLDRRVEGLYKAAIGSINAQPSPVLAIDIPSGLHADTGRVMGTAVEAEATVTFIGLKQGLFTGAGPDHTGTIYFDDLDVPAAVFSAVPLSARRIDLDVFRRLLAPRPRTAHKGQFGHVLVVGGDHGYAGAARMAAEAAARVGAGLVSLGTRASHASVIAMGRPEIMCHGVETPADLAPLLKRVTAIAVGPGIGQSMWASGLLSILLEQGKPMVLDADALNLLAADPMTKNNWVLTPHPGEAARLLGSTTAAVQANRFESARAIQARYGGVCVLKGTGTLIVGADGGLALCNGGNPGMASGGMGDVLTGVIVGLIAQGLSLSDAASLGVCLHAEAADRAAQEGERGLLATDLMPWLRRLANPNQTHP